MKFYNYTFLILVNSLLFISCNSSGKDKNDDGFTFIKRNDYTINSYNGLPYYRLNETKEFMDGYYVVGNKMSKWEEFEFKKGLLHGDYIVFHPNGEIYSQTTYANGKKHGEELMYHNNGILNSKSTFKNNELVGSKFTYFDNGKIQSESRIEDGRPIETQHYNILGNIVSQSFIRNGRTIYQEIVEGKVFSEMVSSNYDNYETMRFYNEDGSTKLYLQRIEENDTMYILELDNEGNELKRIDIKANPEEALKYAALF